MQVIWQLIEIEENERFFKGMFDFIYQLSGDYIFRFSWKDFFIGKDI